MTNRELFHATMRGENGGDLYHFEQAFNVPYKTWYKQGLPEHVENVGWAQLTEYENLYDHFNISGWMMCIIDQFCIPKFEAKVLEIKDGRRITTNVNGNTMMYIDDSIYYKPDGSVFGSPPKEFDFLIKTPEDYENYRHLYIGNPEKRVNQEKLAANAEGVRTQQDFLSAVYVHGPFAFLREMLGTEQAIVLPYEEPEMIVRILKDHMETCKETMAPVIKAVRPDCTFVWEDCCGGSGPFVSPAIFDAMYAPWYLEWKDFVNSMGVKWAILDTDGDPSPLVTRWYGAGFDCMHPWEVNGGDMLKFAAEYPDYCMMGGIYKHIFEPAHPSQAGRFRSGDVREAIDNELKRVVEPMRKRGKYIPSLDHAIVSTANYPDYIYYCDVMQERYGKANRVTRTFKRGFPDGRKPARDESGKYAVI